MLDPEWRHCMKRFAHKVVLVAGGASGIGAASAIRLAEEGAQVAIADLNHDAAALTASRITESGGSAIAIPMDISSEDAVRDAVGGTIKEFGRLHGLFNVAADLRDDIVFSDTNPVDIDMSVFDHTLAVNLRGYVLTCRYAIPEILSAGGGAIVNTSSIASLAGSSRGLSYGVSKAGVNALTRHVAKRWGRENLRCNAIAPGSVFVERKRARGDVDAVPDSVLTPHLGRPEDIAAVAAFLLSDDAAYVTGLVIPADGGELSHFDSGNRATAPQVPQ